MRVASRWVSIQSGRALCPHRGQHSRQGRDDATNDSRPHGHPTPSVARYGLRSDGLGGCPRGRDHRPRGCPRRGAHRRPGRRRRALRASPLSPLHPLVGGRARASPPRPPHPDPRLGVPAGVSPAARHDEDAVRAGSDALAPGQRTGRPQRMASEPAQPGRSAIPPCSACGGQRIGGLQLAGGKANKIGLWPHAQRRSWVWQAFVDVDALVCLSCGNVNLVANDMATLRRAAEQHPERFIW